MGRHEILGDNVVVRRGPERGYLEALWSSVVAMALFDWATYHPESCSDRGTGQAGWWQSADDFIHGDGYCQDDSRDACSVALSISSDDMSLRAEEIRQKMNDICGAPSPAKVRRRAAVRLVKALRAALFFGERGALVLGASVTASGGQCERGDPEACKCGRPQFAFGVCQHCYDQVSDKNKQALGVRRCRRSRAKAKDVAP